MGLFDDDLEKEELREALRKAHRELAKHRNKALTFSEAAHEGAMSAMLALGLPDPVESLWTPGDRGKPEAALVHLTDWQGSKVTTSYNTRVMKERIQFFLERLLDIVTIQRKDHDVDDLIIAFGGDMIEGLFNYPTQPYEIDSSLFDQFVTVAQLISTVVRFGLAQFPGRVLVIPEWGNHGRLGSKRAAVLRSDNADRMTYRLAKEMLGEQPRLTFQEAPEDIQRLEYGNYRALVIHGDEVGRNGFASPMTIVQHVNKWRSGAYRWRFRDVYMGHYHTHAEWPLANGEGAVYQTGSTESDNRYALESMASSAIPSQRLHFIDPRKGRVSAQYKIILSNERLEH